MVGFNKRQVVNVSYRRCYKNIIKISAQGLEFSNRCCVIHINSRADRAFERHVVQRVLHTQYGKIPLSAQQERCKENDACFRYYFTIPRPRCLSILQSIFK
jgi:hypothetical protein